VRPDRTIRRRRPAAVVAVLLLAVLAFGVTVISVAGQAGSTPAPTTTAPAPYEYIPTPAGPPSSSPAGGDR
jgi:ABC-type transporter Mla subunit MlaD